MDRIFVLIANKARTSKFSLNDLPGSAGRMDIVCRFISQSLFISHGIRKNACAYAILKGIPEPCKTIKISGRDVRYLSPDERNIAGMINKALSAKIDEEWREISPGVHVSRKDVPSLLDEFSGRSIYYLREDGDDVHDVEISDPVFVIGDHLGVGVDDEREIIRRADGVLSLGKISYQADQCVTILNYILDRRCEG